MTRGRSRRRGVARALRAAFALGVLLGGLGLPVLGLVLADEPAPLCGARGRCCCAGGPAGQDDRPCLRRACGCEHEDAAPAGGPLRIEAVLPASSRPAVPEPRLLSRANPGETPLARPHAPPVPPPRRPLSA